MWRGGEGDERPPRCGQPWVLPLFSYPLLGPETYSLKSSSVCCTFPRPPTARGRGGDPSICAASGEGRGGGAEISLVLRLCVGARIPLSGVSIGKGLMTDLMGEEKAERPLPPPPSLPLPLTLGIDDSKVVFD